MIRYLVLVRCREMGWREGGIVVMVFPKVRSPEDPRKGVWCVERRGRKSGSEKFSIMLYRYFRWEGTSQNLSVKSVDLDSLYLNVRWNPNTPLGIYSPNSGLPILKYPAIRTVVHLSTVIDLHSMWLYWCPRTEFFHIGTSFSPQENGTR